MHALWADDAIFLQYLFMQQILCDILYLVEGNQDFTLARQAGNIDHAVRTANVSA